MKEPKPAGAFNFGPALKAPTAPRVTKATEFAAFAHHPPAPPRGEPHMERPHGGKGPRN
jgi:hypothetical protein